MVTENSGDTSRMYEEALDRIFKKVDEDTLRMFREKTGFDPGKHGVTRMTFKSGFQTEIFGEYLKRIDTTNAPAWFHKFLEFFEAFKKEGCVAGCGSCCSDYGQEKEILEAVDEQSLPVPQYPGCSAFTFEDEKSTVEKEIILNGSRIGKVCPFLKFCSYPDGKEFDVKGISIGRDTPRVELDGSENYMAMCGIHDSREELIEKVSEKHGLRNCITHQAEPEYSCDCIKALIKYAKRVS